MPAPPASRILASVTASLAALVLAACQSSPAPAAGQKEYPLRGQVVAVRPDVREIRINHAAIPGLMDAMTMSFGVRDPELLRGRVPGDLVEGTLVVTDGDAWLASLRNVGHAPLDAEADTPSPPAVADVLLRPGEALPDERFTDSTGRAWRPSNARGRAVAMTFTYTRCPLAEFCPRLDRSFLEAQRLARLRPGLSDHIQFVTISFDPQHDTPNTLARHAATLGADLSNWVFATGSEDLVERFGARLGLTVIGDGESPVDITHNMRTAIVDPGGRLVKVLNGADWTPADLVDALATAAAS